MIIMKFGGTSVQDASAMSRVIDIVRRQSGKRIIVSSACSGVTDMLLKYIDLSGRNLSAEASVLFAKLIDKHREIILELISNNIIKEKTLGKVMSLLSELRTIGEGAALLGEATPRTKDKAVSYGELLSTTILFGAFLSEGLESAFLDARSVISTDSNFTAANVNFDDTFSNARDIIQPLLTEKDIIIVQGFIALDKEGRTTTLGRGGSDYSAAIFGAVLGADEIQIWTDVDGVLSADPRLVRNFAPINTMTFEEIRLLAFWGAKVIHPDTLLPAIECSIPVRILNTFNPDFQGTTILEKIDDAKPAIHSISLKSKCLLLKIDCQFKELEAEIYNLIKLLGGKVLCFTGSDTRKIIIAGDFPDLNVAELQLKNGGIYAEEVSGICLCGIELKRLNITEKTLISEILHSYSPELTLWGINDFILLSFFKSNLALDALQDLHKNLIIS